MADIGTIDNSISRHLPAEIIVHILSLLPVKSLCRLKCVSPSWNSLISSPQFSKTHLHITNTTNKPQKAILISCFGALYSVDFTKENSTAKKLDFPLVEPSDDWTRSFGSCNGLVLVSSRDRSKFLLNPFTSECKKLPKSPFDDFFSPPGSYILLPGLGYDSYTDDYKVVMLYYDRFKSHPQYEFHGDDSITYVAVYSLKTDAWRRIQETHFIPVDAVAGVHFNERLHWLCRRTGGLDGSVVVAFNLSDEIFREVQWPALLDDHKFEFEPQMAVLGGCLSLVVWQPSQLVDVWMMKKYGVRESWTKFKIAHGMNILDFLYLSAEEEFVSEIYGMILDVHGDNMLDESNAEKLVVYNPRKETLRTMVVSGLPTQYTVGHKYIETLVSPNHGGRIRRYYEASSGESSKSYQVYFQHRNDYVPSVFG